MPSLRPTMFALALALIGCPKTTPVPPAEPEVAPAEVGLSYPEARRGDVVDDYHGTAVADPYRWLEDPDAPETRTWIDAQNELTQAWVGEVAAREAIHDRLESMWNHERFSIPREHAGRYFYTRNDGLQAQSVLYWTEGLDGEPTVLLDPNTLSEDGTVSLARYAVSEDGRYLAYGLADGGSDWTTWHVRDVESGEDLDDEVGWIKFGGVAWTHDSAGFYYGRFPEPTNALEDVNRDHKLYYHRLGTPQSEDVLVHENPDEPEWSFSPGVTDDGRWLVITVGRSTEERNLLYVQDLEDPESELQVVVDTWDAAYLPVGNEGTRFVVQTTLDAPRGRVVSIDLEHPERDAWEELIPQADETLQDTSWVGGKLVVDYLKDAYTVVRVFETDGTPVGEVDLPGIGSAYGFGGTQDDPETFFAWSSYTTPWTIWRYDLSTGERAVFKAPEVDFDPSPYVVEQIFYDSADGTEVPMFLVHREGIELDGSHPTMLYGYGGFSVSLTPSFRVARAVWLEMGGIYAVANLRGGGEYGEEWHEAGILANKQNVFDDFIAAAEWLIDSGYTTPDKLAIAGGSNGGLLVGAVLEQRPELFGAALPAVGVMDMLRYHLFTIGWAWAADYGTSDDPEMFEVLHAYSPYHNAEPGVAYPATFVTTGDHDDRVVPAHSFKFTAALQHAQAGPEPILIRIETRAGHSAGKPTAMRIAEYADEYAFMVRALDMDLEGFGGQ